MSEELGLFGEEAVPAAPEPVEAPDPAPVVEPAPEAPKPAEPTGEKKDASPASERQRDEQGRFAPKSDAEPMVPLSAMLAERERRQKAEEKAQAAVPPLDIFADPKGFIKAELDAREGPLMEKATEAARSQFLQFTENSARSRHTDYDVAREAFAEEAQRNPMMVQKLRDAADPGEFIYQQGKTAIELRSVGGDLSAYRKHIETETIARLEKERTAREARNAGIPQSLNAEPSKGAGVQGSSAWAGPTPDKELFPER